MREPGCRDLVAQPEVCQRAARKLNVRHRRLFLAKLVHPRVDAQRLGTRYPAQVIEAVRAGILAATPFIPTPDELNRILLLNGEQQS